MKLNYIKKTMKEKKEKSRNQEILRKRKMQYYSKNKDKILRNKKSNYEDNKKAISEK